MTNMTNSLLGICHICLRCDKKLFRLNYELESYYADLCDYAHLSAAQFCGECITRLRHCYNFKDICLTASKKLKNWKKQKASEKVSIKSLHRELSYPQLNLSNKRNFQVHFCQSLDLDSTASFEVSNSKHPHIVTVNIPQEGKTELYCQIEVTEEPTEATNIADNIKQEEVDFVAFDDTEHILDDEEIPKTENTIETKSEILNSDDDLTDNSSDSEYLVNNTTKGKKIKQNDSDSDESLDNFIAKYITPINKKLDAPDTKGVRKKKENSKKNVSLEILRERMREKFERYKPLKDKKGNDINSDIVLDYFDKLSNRKLITIQKHCAIKGPFTSKAIDIISEIHNKYSGYEELGYTIEYIHDDDQVRVEFEKRRESAQYTEAQFRCESCYKGFKYEGQLRDHMTTTHNEAFTIECKLCKARIKHKKRLAFHMTGHRQLYKCKLCPFVTPNRHPIIQHCNRHAGLKYKCKECDKEFASRSVMYTHYRRYHEPKHPCELCALSFSSQNGLAHHKAFKHKGESFVESPDNTRCETCNVNFITDKVYQKHVKISHGIWKNGPRKPVIATCPMCGDSGKGSLWLAGHMKRLHPGAPSTLRAHTHLCATCGKGFSNENLYKDHMNVHMDIRPYSCPYCPKTFHRMHNLYVHKERHLPPAHVCSFCGKKFLSAANLYSHKRTHIGDRRFKCEYCGKGFLHKGTMREHVNGVHFNIKKKRNSKMSSP